VVAVLATVSRDVKMMDFACKGPVGAVALVAAMAPRWRWRWRRGVCDPVAGWQTHRSGRR
jgi:hypothetical protein